MFSVLFIGMAVTFAASELSDDDRAKYEATKADAGRNPEAHVKLALWCEAHGLNTERVKHLAIAVLIDPDNAVARGLMGLVEYQGKWQRPEFIATQTKHDDAFAALIVEYNGRRARMKNTADAHWKLALWCEESGLKPEAMAHLTAVTRLDPGREAAWKRLGCKKLAGRWISTADLATAKAEKLQQANANRYWMPRLAKWRRWLGDKHKRPEAEAALSALADPRAVSSIWQVFVEPGSDHHLLAVKLLSQIDARSASEILAILAISSPSASARREATETLRQRDERDYVSLLISMLRKPIRYQVKRVNGPGSTGVLLVEGTRFSLERLYEPPPMPNIPLNAALNTYVDQFGSPVVSLFDGSWNDQKAEQHVTVSNRQPIYDSVLKGSLGFYHTTTTQTTFLSHLSKTYVPIGQVAGDYSFAALTAQQQLENDLRLVESFNAALGRRNEAISHVLKDVTGSDFGVDRDAWMKWWADQLGYVYSAPTPKGPSERIIESVPLAYAPRAVPTLSLTETAVTGSTTQTTRVATQFNRSCFGAGTPVHTIRGLKPIDTLRVGDQVLTQDTRRGDLSFQPLVAVFHNPPAGTLRIQTDSGDEVVATGIHRFWKSGVGWTMARDLRKGDSIRAIGRSTKVVGVQAETVQPVYNAEVASGRSFFVGKTGLLVHDNSLVRQSAEPFDAPGSLAVK